MASSAKQKNEGPSKLYGEALRLLYEGKYDKARAALVGFQERHSDQLQMLSRARVFLKACDRLEGNGGTAEKANPGDLYVIGLIEHNRGEHSKAVEIWQNALKKSPSDGSDLHLAIAAGLTRQGKSGDALKHLKKSIEMDPTNRIVAANDPDFEPLHRNDEFLKMVRRSGRK